MSKLNRYSLEQRFVARLLFHKLLEKGLIFVLFASCLFPMGVMIATLWSLLGYLLSSFNQNNDFSFSSEMLKVLWIWCRVMGFILALLITWFQSMKLIFQKPRLVHVLKVTVVPPSPYGDDYPTHVCYQLAEFPGELIKVVMPSAFHWNRIAIAWVARFSDDNKPSVIEGC